MLNMENTKSSTYYAGIRMKNFLSFAFLFSFDFMLPWNVVL